MDGGEEGADWQADHCYCKEEEFVDYRSSSYFSQTFLQRWISLHAVSADMGNGPAEARRRHTLARPEMCLRLTGLTVEAHLGTLGAFFRTAHCGAKPWLVGSVAEIGQVTYKSEKGWFKDRGAVASSGWSLSSNKTCQR
jgi:hypothetical protein